MGLTGLRKSVWSPQLYLSILRSKTTAEDGQLWSLWGLRRNPPKRVLLRQGFSGHPLRIPPELYSYGFLRRRVKRILL